MAASTGPRWAGAASRAIDRLADASAGRALRDGMLWLLPYMMIWVVLRLMAAFAPWWPATSGVAPFLAEAASHLRGALPLAIWGSIGAMLALQRQLPRTAVAFMCVAIGMVSQQILLQIDDFGTGYSSLSYLHRYPVDGIKIDRSFTAALTHPKGRDVFRELCGMARQLKLDVVVEGVEEAWQLEFMPTDIDVCVQGWYYAKALPAQEFSEFVKTRELL